MSRRSRRVEPAETLERTKLLAFVAQSLAVRSTKETDFDDVDATIASVRHALNELDLVLPTPDEVANHDLRQGCVLLNDAIDLIEEADGERLPRPVRRRVAVLNARASEHMSRAVDRLGKVKFISPDRDRQPLNRDQQN
jgi:hypothetical protein